MPPCGSTSELAAVTRGPCVSPESGTGALRPKCEWMLMDSKRKTALDILYFSFQIHLHPAPHPRAPTSKACTPQAPLPSSCWLISSREALAGHGVERKGSGNIIPHPAPSWAGCCLAVAAFLSVRPKLLSGDPFSFLLWLQTVQMYSSLPRVLGHI